MGREWRTDGERMWEIKILVEKRRFLGNLYDEWKKIGQYNVLREMGDSCEWALWMTVRREGSNCHSIIIELLNGRTYCVSRWYYATGSDSCCDKWWRCKKRRTRQIDLFSLTLFTSGLSATDLLWCLVVWELWRCGVGISRGGQIHILVLWVVAPYSVARGYQSLGEAHSLHSYYGILFYGTVLFGKLRGNTLPIFWTLKMRALCCSEVRCLPTRLRGVLNQKTAVL
jgi:hypothetical protein